MPGYASFRIVPLVSLVAVLVMATPVAAEDAATVGILAGAGIAAATGKTTLGDSAGAIEAGLYGAEGFQQAGAIIASVVNARRNDRPVLLLAHGETIDLITPVVILDRINRVHQLVTNRCVKPKGGNDVQKILKGLSGLEAKLALQELAEGIDAEAAPAEPAKAKSFLGKVTSADVAGAIKIDTSIAGIALTADDRMLVNAVMMNGRRPAWTGQADGTGWTVWPDTAPAGPALATLAYRIPSEGTAMPADSASRIAPAYRALVTFVTDHRLDCQTGDGKAAIDLADALINSLNSSDKGPPPLSVAIQSEVYATGQPLVLRLAVEQAGGTAITRSGVFYTFGLPNAATVGAGLIVSFRLIDPANGALHALGVVRCVARQSNIKKVADYLRHPVWKKTDKSLTQSYPLGATICDFRWAG